MPGTSTRTKRSHLSLAVILLMLSLGLGQSFAAETKVPLFRYSMSHWETAPYRLVVFFKGEISEEQSQWLESVRSVSLEGEETLNIVMEYVDVSDTVTSYTDVVPLIAPALNKNEKIPQLVLMYPSESNLKSPAWHGPLTKQNIRDLMNSPLREKLIMELVSGKSGVWILVESDDKDLNEKAADVLARAIRKARLELKLPARKELKDYKEDNTVPYNLDFSVIRLSKKAYREQIFASMLAGVEEDLRQYYDGGDPLAIFIYGRGRTMAGSMFAETMRVEDAFTNMSYAVEPPQDTTASEQQALDPSVDLLLTINWKEKIIVDVKQRMIEKQKLDLKEKSTQIASLETMITEAKDQYADAEKTIADLEKQIEAARKQTQKQKASVAQTENAGSGKGYSKPGGIAFLGWIMIGLLGIAGICAFVIVRD